MGITLDRPRAHRLLLRMAALSPGMMSLPALAFIAVQAPPAPTTAPQDPTSSVASAELCATIQAELAAQPNVKSVEDLEAVIVFRLSQTGQAWNLQNPALSCVGSSAGASAALRQAVANVQTAFLHQRLTIGTGAITGGSAGIFGRSSFNGPVLYVGGGTSDYSS